MQKPNLTLAPTLLLFTTLLLLQSCGSYSPYQADAHPPQASTPINTSHYIPTPDGTRIAIDIYRPAGSDASSPVPTLMEFTRYWRVVEHAPIKDRVQFFLDQGFAYALVDGRGSGASFGVRKVEFAAQEAKDFGMVINWVAAQHWSNGQVATTGVSYAGNTAEMAMVDAPVALRATVPRFTDFDLYSAILFPGGLANTQFLLPWSRGVNALDTNQTATIDQIHPIWAGLEHQSVKPVDADTDRRLLNQAARQHQANIPLEQTIGQIVYRDDMLFANQLDAPADHWASPHRFQNNPRLQSIPSFHWASFTDAGTAAGAIARFQGSQAPMQEVIGYWTHGANEDTNPFMPMDHPVSPSMMAQQAQVLDFLAPLKDANQRFKQTKQLHYFTAGENRWKQTEVWPPEGIKPQRFYLGEHASLQPTAPTERADKDRYAVNFKAGTGEFTRWSTQFKGKDVYYGNRAEADKLLLTYTSAPLEHSIEITGAPVLELQLSSTTPDGALIAYLEAVAPDGTVTMLTEGELRLIHRKESSQPAPYPMPGPYHSFLKQDAEPMPPGEVQRVAFAMLPLSVQLPKGHALRLAIAGHDKDSFQRVPEMGTPVYEVFRQMGALSFLELPMRVEGVQLPF